MRVTSIKVGHSRVRLKEHTPCNQYRYHNRLYVSSYTTGLKDEADGELSMCIELDGRKYDFRLTQQEVLGLQEEIRKALT